MNEYKTCEPVCEDCNPERYTLAKRVDATGGMLAEALKITNQINITLFGDENEDCERPIPKTLEHDMEINENGMRSLLAMLVRLRDRLF